MGDHLIVVVVMKALLKPLLLVSAVASIPGLGHAALRGDPAHHRARSAATALAASPPDRSLAQMDLVPRLYLKRPYAPSSAAAPEPETPVTALSGQIASDGPIGSVGLINLSGRATMADRSFGDSLASQRGLPSRALGFQVSYNFP